VIAQLQSAGRNHRHRHTSREEFQRRQRSSVDQTQQPTIYSEMNKDITLGYRIGNIAHEEKNPSAKRHPLPNGAFKEEEMASSSLIFPDDDLLDDQNVQKPKKKNNIQSQIVDQFKCTSSLCEEIDNYPEEEILHSLQKESSLKSLRAKLYPGKDEQDNLFQEISTRDAPVPLYDEKPLCSYNTKKTYPKYGITSKGERMFIVNIADHNYTQTVIGEVCKDVEEPCSNTDVFRSGVETVCRQKYVSRLLIAMNDNKKIVEEEFPVPTSCVCYVKTKRRSARWLHVSRRSYQHLTRN